MSEPSSTPGQSVSVRTDGGQMPAELWLPDGGTGPGLLLLQEIFGVSRYIQARAATLAEAGYVVLAPALYWRIDAEPIDESADDAIETAMGRMQQLDWGTAIDDSAHALRHLRGRDEVRGGTGVIGFCLGGGLGFNLAAVEQPDVLVSYYGSAIPGLLDLAAQVSVPTLHHFGLADEYIPAATVAEIESVVTSGRADVEVETYEGANHAFDNWNFGFHHPEASALAWERTIAFLHRELPTG
jgi:carboxymethylenebutenolidase